MKKRQFKIIISLILFIIGMIIKFRNEYISKFIFIISYIIVGYDILKKAVKNILKKEIFDENFLMSIATIGAFGVGEFPEAVAVMLFYQIGELFQSYAVDKSRKSISSLIDIRPDFANVIRENIIEKVEPDEVKIGEEILVKPGEKIPLDGIVLHGESMINTKALTGESVPRKVIVGNEVLSGCINESGVLKIKVTKEFEESTVNKILELVENASSKKSKSENFINKFSKYYTPIVVIIAAIIAIFPPVILNNASYTDWVYRALSFLVVSCPCALVISVPLSFFGGIGGASKIGILIKGSNYLESLSKTEVVVFDKTGTLTEGVFDVQKVESVGISKEELIEIVAYAEKFSNHPIANSVRKAYGKEIDESKIMDICELSGKGIFAKVDGKEVLVGNEKLMQEKNIYYKNCEEVGTVLYVSIDNSFAGYILISDKIKSDSKKAIESLKSIGIKQIVMLTGDRKKVAEDVSKKLELNSVYTELLPNDKVQKLEELLKGKSKSGKLIFVGDGINDAPVIAMSDVGVAMGGLGADSAIEAADVVIMTDEPSKVGMAIKIAKKNMRIVKENIVFAIFVKICVLILSAFGISTMWEAVFADVGVSIIAIVNALRMLNVK